MKDVILRNAEAETALCAARKNFKPIDGVLSESTSKTVICHISDVHCDWERLKNAIELINYVKPLFVVHTGDTVKWDCLDDTSPFYELTRDTNAPVYNVIGNHETFMGKEKTSREYLDARFISPLSGTFGEGKCYYGVDFDGLRLIALNDYDNETPEFRDSYELGQEQVDWLVRVLEDCDKKGIAVIIAGHESDEVVPPASNDKGFCQRVEPYPWGIPKPRECTLVADLIDAFKKGGSVEREYEWRSGNKVEVKAKFTRKNEFVCHLSGHRHGDYIGYLPSYPDQLSACVTCTGCFPAGYHNIGDEVSDLPRIPGTISEDAINFYVIDRENGTLTAVRFGSRVNDLFESRLVAKYKY